MTIIRKTKTVNVLLQAFEETNDAISIVELVNKFESYFNDIKLMSFTNYNNFENYYPLIIQYILYNLNFYQAQVFMVLV